MKAATDVEGSRRFPTGRSVGLFLLGVIITPIPWVYILYMTPLLVGGAGSPVLAWVVVGIQLTEFVGLMVLYIRRGNPLFVGSAITCAGLSIALWSTQ